MSTTCKFHDYVDESKVNVIHSWLGNIPKQVKVKFTNRLVHIEGTGEWKRPFVDTLTGDCDGLFEVRAKHAKEQYRILGSREQRSLNPILLHGFRKRSPSVPLAECDEAFRRLENVKAHTGVYEVEHNYG